MVIQLFTIAITYTISLGIGLLINVMFQNHHNHQIERLT